MKVLMVAPVLPYPTDSGLKTRLVAVLKAMSQAHEVTLLAYYRSPDEMDQAAKLCHRVVGVPHDRCARSRPSAAPGRMHKIMETLRSPRPSLVSTWYSRDLAEECGRLTADPYDVIWVVRLWLDAVLPAPPPNAVLDLDEFESVKWFRRLTTLPPGLTRAIRYVDALKLARSERRAIKRYAAVLVSSETERRVIPEAQNVFVLPNAVSAPDSDAEAAAGESSDDLVFIGTMGYGPNVDAVEFFYASIWPLIKQNRPGARLWIVGPEPAETIRRLHDGTSVLVTGYVEDLEALLRRSGVVVVPLRDGGGTRIKILQAMALSKAVVSTTVGCEGLDVVDGEHLLVADQPGEFARQCIALMEDPSRRRRLGENARRLVEEKHRWELLPRVIDRVLESACIGARRA